MPAELPELVLTVVMRRGLNRECQPESCVGGFGGGSAQRVVLRRRSAELYAGGESVDPLAGRFRIRTYASIYIVIRAVGRAGFVGGSG
ncbi:hypothetical protein Acy02nite_34610 [Actinoplanes cyaneus]|uniref:Uncharacterized protein n=1 Tax=Actinoplanes cyaneus TaxID=52696 RepID=A0A919IGF4_9ACTN|nr:hypothetical protein Acy02nite_34610 [Actinoplanes cyaneus]